MNRDLPLDQCQPTWDYEFLVPEPLSFAAIALVGNVSAVDTVEPLVGVWIVGLVALVVVCAVALFVRYRRANATEREQIKWLLYAVLTAILGYPLLVVVRTALTSALPLMVATRCW